MLGRGARRRKDRRAGGDVPIWGQQHCSASYHCTPGAAGAVYLGYLLHIVSHCQVLNYTGKYIT